MLPAIVNHRMDLQEEETSNIDKKLSQPFMHERLISNDKLAVESGLIQSSSMPIMLFAADPGNLLLSDSDKSFEEKKMQEREKNKPFLLSFEPMCQIEEEEKSLPDSD